MSDAARWTGPVALLLVAGGLVGGGLLARTQSTELTTLRGQVSALKQSDAEQKAAAASDAAALDDAKGQIARLSAALTAAQNRLAENEKKLDLTSSQLPPDVSKLAGQVVPSVVYLSCGSGAGSGFAVDLPAQTSGATTILTAAHVVTDCATPGPTGETSQLGVSTADSTARGVVREIDPDSDLALVEVELAIDPLRFAGQNPSQGEFVLAVGNPLGAVALAGSVTQGTVSKVVGDRVTHTAPISSGNSGGPLVNRSGEVVAVVTALIASQDGVHTENLNLAVRPKALCSKALSGPVCTSLH